LICDIAPDIFLAIGHFLYIHEEVLVNGHICGQMRTLRLYGFFPNMVSKGG